MPNRIKLPYEYITKKKKRILKLETRYFSSEQKRNFS